MTTRTVMLAAIADDIADTASAYTTQIARAISRAISHYQNERFYFNEGRSTTFPTVASQQDYTSADSTVIKSAKRIDALFMTTGSVYELTRCTPEEIEIVTGASSTGKPLDYAYFGQTLRLYPVPDAVYTLRIQGHIVVAEPASDGEADNAWMTDGYDLILSRAEWYLAMHTLRDELMARLALMAEERALSALRSVTATKLGRGFVTPTQF